VNECKPLPVRCVALAREVATVPIMDMLLSGLKLISRTRPESTTASQGLTLVHFSAQLEPCLSHENTLHTLNNPNTPSTRATQPLRAPPFP
jgi:hypothetical protein